MPDFHALQGCRCRVCGPEANGTGATALALERSLTHRLVDEGELTAIVTGSDDDGQLTESFEVRFNRR